MIDIPPVDGLRILSAVHISYYTTKIYFCRCFRGKNGKISRLSQPFREECRLNFTLFSDIAPLSGGLGERPE